MFQVEGTGYNFTLADIRSMSFEDARYYLAKLKANRERIARATTSRGADSGEGWLDDDELEVEGEGEPSGDDTPAHLLRVSDMHLPEIDVTPDEDECE